MVGVLCRVRAPSPPQQPSDSSFHDGSEVKASAPNAGGPGSQVQPLGREDPLEKEMATHSSVSACKSRAQRSLAGYSPWGRKRVGQNLATKQQQVFVDSTLKNHQQRCI